MGVRRSRRYTQRARSLLRTLIGLQELKRLLEPHGERYTSRIEELQKIGRKRLRENQRK